MPEGDTLHRAAVNLRRWLVGGTVTAVAGTALGSHGERLVGADVEQVEALGKHLVVRFSNGLAVRTHMRMTGSWHVYPRGARWRKPAHRARLVLEAGERVAVCFDAPEVELLHARDEATHPALRRLGPDVLVEPLDLEDVVRRARAVPRDAPVGDVLLDQSVVAGIGNIWRCEALFRERTNPATRIGDVGDDVVRRVVRTASELMKASVAGRRPRAAVYGRTGRPCPRCGTAVESSRQGRDARTAYWCPSCQRASNVAAP